MQTSSLYTYEYKFNVLTHNQNLLDRVLPDTPNYVPVFAQIANINPDILIHSFIFTILGNSLHDDILL
jgi:hypothetical protein